MTGELAELRGEAWVRLLAKARKSLESSGGALDRSIGLPAPADSERRLVIGITGQYRPETARRLTIGLTDLDAALRRRYGTGLRETLEALGGPLRDRPVEREREARERETLVAAATGSVLAAEPWYQAWLSVLRADGGLTRLVRRDNQLMLGQAIRILEYLHARDPGDPVPLPVLAERFTGDTKALLAGGPLATLVLRALAARSGVDSIPRDRAGQRALWETSGAIADDLASQVLVLNVPCDGDDMVSGWLNDAARSGMPFRLTLQQAVPVGAPTVADIYVCENPAVLRVAAAELGAASAALVCTEGVPSAACHAMLGKAASRGARLHWRADFDWVGLRLVAAAIAKYGAQPWRMTARDYRDALAAGDTTALVGPKATSPWDPRLAPLMAERDRAVMEERLIATLVDDLKSLSPVTGARRLLGKPSPSPGLYSDSPSNERTRSLVYPWDSFSGSGGGSLLCRIPLRHRSFRGAEREIGGGGTMEAMTRVMAMAISVVPILIAVAGCATRAPGGPAGTGAASPVGSASADAAPSRYATVVGVPAGGRNPQAAIPDPGTGTGNPRLVQALLPQSSFRREAAFLLPPAVVALPDRDRGSLFIGLRQYSSPVTGPLACNGWTGGLWSVAVTSFNLPGVQLAVTEQAVPTTSGLPMFSEAIITGSPSVLDAMGDPPLPAKCRTITSQPYSGGVKPIVTRLGPGSPRTRAFEITGTGKVPVWQWAEVVQGPGFLLEIRIPNQAANADPGAALAKITTTAYRRAAAFLASNER